MLTITAASDRFISGANARMVANGPRTLATKIASISSSVSASRSACGIIRVKPAEFTSTSQRPYSRSTIAATSRSAAVSSIGMRATR